jgi:hypothetical protein
VCEREREREGQTDREKGRVKESKREMNFKKGAQLAG